MGYDAYAKSVIGVRFEAIATGETKTVKKTVQKFDEDTGKPYEKQIIETVTRFFIGTRDITDQVEAQLLYSAVSEWLEKNAGMLGVKLEVFAQSSESHDDPDLVGLEIADTGYDKKVVEIELGRLGDHFAKVSGVLRQLGCNAKVKLYTYLYESC